MSEAEEKTGQAEGEAEQSAETAKGAKEKRPRESLLTLVPRLARFVYHLSRDPRVPWGVKGALVGLAAYLACPIDIIPDWIPAAGYLDDVLVIGFALSYVLARVPPDVVREHWGEDVQTLERLRDLTRRKGKPKSDEPVH